MSAPTARLGDLVDILSGFAFDAANFSDEGDIALIRIRDVIRGQSSTFYRGDYDDKYLIQKGEILIGMDGEFNRARWQSAPALLNQRVCKIKSNSPKLSDEYLFHFLPAALKAIEDTTSFVTVKHLSAKQIKDISIPLPPVEEQRRIAAILDQAETLRTQRRTALALLDGLTQSLFLDMFGDPVANPKGWSMSTIGDLAEVQGGLQVTSARKNLPVEVPYLRVANVYRSVLDLSEIKTIRATPAEIQRTTLVKDDLLVVEGHGNPNEIGRAALWKGEIEQCVHQNHLIRARFDCTKIEPLFASEYVNSPGGRQHLLRAGKSTSGLNTISVSNVRETPIGLPPLPLQQTFATRIAAIEALKATHRRALAALDALFASLQQQAFSGELTPPAPRASAQNLEQLQQLKVSIGQEALIFIAKRMPDGDLYNSLKAIYFADRHHLEHHGRQIYNETYSALTHGPVPQAAYDAANVLIGKLMFSSFDDDAVRAALRRKGDTLTALRDADFSKLSRAVIESLEWGIRYCRDMKFGQTKTASHDSAYERTPKNEAIPLQYIIDTLPPEARQRHWNKSL